MGYDEGAIVCDHQGDITELPIAELHVPIAGACIRRSWPRTASGGGS